MCGTAEEGPHLDFKEDLPGAGKNQELAKDIAAMTVNGGVGASRAGRGWIPGTTASGRALERNGQLI